MFQPRNLGKAEASLSADAAVILVFPEDGFLSPIIGTGREPGARVPPWILDAELQYFLGPTKVGFLFLSAPKYFIIEQN